DRRPFYHPALSGTVGQVTRQKEKEATETPKHGEDHQGKTKNSFVFSLDRLFRVSESPWLSLFRERDPLNPPVAQLADQQFVLVAAVDRVHEAELFQLLAGAAELAEDLAVEIQLVDRG